MEASELKSVLKEVLDETNAGLVQRVHALEEALKQQQGFGSTARISLAIHGLRRVEGFPTDYRALLFVKSSLACARLFFREIVPRR
jgi:hypothetical protein